MKGLFQACCLLILSAEISLLPGWGDKPHHDIVDAALSALPPQDRLIERLGPEARKLTTYVMMADWKDSLLSIREDWTINQQRATDIAVQFYSNDYLIFPGVRRFYQHDLPDVANTYRPYFLRALQALRTESPSNAARWLGSLLHFVTDSGSPPHTVPYKGEIHTKMENWLDGTQIDMKGYRPRLLGATDEDALAAFLIRMRDLADFSRPRAERLLPLIQANDRARCEPIALESAAETARVAADTLHTLLVLSASAAPGAELQAEVTAAGMQCLPAKLILLGTNYSTVSEPVSLRQQRYQGTFRLGNLPPGVYRPAVYRTGARTIFVEPVTLKAGETVRVKWDLEAETTTGNLVRNADLKVRWTFKDRPEHWSYDARKKRWVSDGILIEGGKSYGAVIEASPAAKVSLQWMSEVWQSPVSVQDLPHGETTLIAPASCKLAQLVIDGAEDPAARVQGVFLAPR